MNMKTLYFPLFVVISALCFPLAAEARGQNTNAASQSADLQPLQSVMSGQNQAADRKKTYGTFGLKLGAGFLNYQSDWYNPSLGITRIYSFALPAISMSAEINLRFGKEENWYSGQNGAGFSYYRSNRGFFADAEIGFKTLYDRGPSDYWVKLFRGKTALSSDYIDLGSSASYALDNIDIATRTLAGDRAARITLVYFNNYFHMNFLNYVMNFGKEMRWFDLSVGPSLQVAHYADYADPIHLSGLTSDSTVTNLTLGIRQYIQLHPRVRFFGHYFWPFYSQLARLVHDRETNNEEHVANAGVELMLIDYVVISAGYEYRLFIANPSSSLKNNQYRPGYEQLTRSTGDLFAQIGFEYPL